MCYVYLNKLSIPHKQKEKNSWQTENLRNGQKKCTYDYVGPTVYKKLERMFYRVLISIRLLLLSLGLLLLIIVLIVLVNYYVVLAAHLKIKFIGLLYLVIN